MDRLKRRHTVKQFSLRDIAVVILFLAINFPLSRLAEQQGLGAGQITLMIGLTLHIGGCLALWAKLVPAGVALLFGGLGAYLAGALLAGGFPIGT
jgi:hypothetical protein